jgi:hypothetical protein
MVMGFIKKTGDRIGQKAKDAAKGDVGAIAETAANVATFGQASALGQALDEGEGLFETPKPEEIKAQDAGRTEEQKSQLRQSLADRQQKVAEAFDPGNFQKRQAQTSALGQSLQNNLQQVSAAQVGNVRPTSIAAPGSRQSVAPQFGNIDTQAGIAQTGQVDLSSPQLAALRGVNIGPGQGAAAQSQLLSALQQQAAGQGPSLAANQFQQAQEANLRAALAQQASLRGGFDPAAARQIRQSQADLQARAAQDAAQARIQEQLAARQQLAGVAGNVEQQQLQRGQLDLSARGQEAQQDVAQAGITQNAQKLQLDSEIQRAASSRNVADQQIAMATTVAQLEDAAVAQEYDANFRTALAQGQIDAQAAAQEFDANLERVMTNMDQQNDTIRQIYQNDVEALKDDIDLANRVYLAGVQADLSIDEMKFQLENAFQQEGMDQANARVAAENAFNNAMYQRELSIKQQQQARLGAGLQAIGTLGGAAVGALGGNPAAGAQLGGSLGGAAAGGVTGQAPTGGV